MSGSTDLADWIYDERMKARAQALEEAARVAENFSYSPGEEPTTAVAAAIRALKDRHNNR